MQDTAHHSGNRFAFDDAKERVRASLPMVELCASAGVILKRSGARFIGHCPFHEEKSGSFTTGGRFPDRAHCFGCGWDGDIFKFWQERRGIDFVTALRELAAMTGVHIADNVDWASIPVTFKPIPKRQPAREILEKPALPPLRRLHASEVAQIARNRGLSADGVACAAYRFSRIGYAEWPQFLQPPTSDLRPPDWTPSATAAPSWCITDSTRNTAEFRRLDGEKYQIANGREIKTWSTSGKSWPIGAADMEHRRCVLLVEGGPDVLAGYHFLHRFGMLDVVAVVGILGAANRIREDALPYFDGARVRIMMDGDSAGLKAAGRWKDQLREAGAVVRVYFPTGVQRPDGQPVKDLNDLALCDSDLVDSDEIVHAFMNWRDGFGA